MRPVPAGPVRRRPYAKHDPRGVTATSRRTSYRRRERWKCRFDDPNVAFRSERLHLWAGGRVHGFMQSDGCAVVVDMPRCPEPVERE